MVLEFVTVQKINQIIYLLQYSCCINKRPSACDRSAINQINILAAFVSVKRTPRIVYMNGKLNAWLISCFMDEFISSYLALYSFLSLTRLRVLISSHVHQNLEESDIDVEADTVSNIGLKKKHYLKS
ncbi:hypothetical protein EGR_01467 [Echinococcus granulosus]|uniref:Uncharacterized protein n=1 Tax=Echinococcus granulosus TaxID=6210 RepID=W6VAN3_ECHGR|nr:hypothetical protein EGR_01467 [Echinococcus granulosus]EUB63844.1 hypothetical protein EGR_01467 [Echinococcus granulosus]